MTTADVTVRRIVAGSRRDGCVPLRTTPRGAFLIATRPIKSRRAHLATETVSLWKRGAFRRLIGVSSCGTVLSSAEIHVEVPDGIELCDDCVLVDYPAPVSVYRLYDSFGCVLYIGCTTNLLSRLRSHAAGQRPSRWWPEVARWTFELFDSLEEGLQAEARAIVAERPLHNTDLTDRARHPRRRRAANLHLVREVAA